MNNAAGVGGGGAGAGPGQGRAVEQKKWTILHNYLYQIYAISPKHKAAFHLEDSDIQYEESLGVDVWQLNKNNEVVKNKKTQVRAITNFGGKLFQSEWAMKKPDTKEDIAIKITEYINTGAVLGGLGWVSAAALTLQVLPGQFWWQRERAALGLDKKNKKTKTAQERRRKKLFDMYPKFFADKMWCCTCKVLNFVQHESCHRCNKNKKDCMEEQKQIEEEKNNIGVLDLERTGLGHQEVSLIKMLVLDKLSHSQATPLSVGIVTLTPEMLVTDECEIYVLPDENSPWPDPKKNSYNTVKFHHLYIEKDKKGVRKMYKLGSRKPLPAVSEKEAVNQFMDYIKKHRIDRVLFHGKDHISLRPFLSKQVNKRLKMKKTMLTGMVSIHLPPFIPP